MFGLKTAKDRLIEHLETELRAAREENERLRSEISRMQAEISAPPSRSIPAEDPRKPKTPRFMGDRCRDLTARSMQGAIRRDPKRNLVAEMPPPGAVPRGTVIVEGPVSANGS